MNSKIGRAVSFVTALAIFAGVLAGMSALFMLAWNVVMVQATNAEPLTFLQTYGGVTLVFGGIALVKFIHSYLEGTRERIRAKVAKEAMEGLMNEMEKMNAEMEKTKGDDELPDDDSVFRHFM